MSCKRITSVSLSIWAIITILLLTCAPVMAANWELGQGEGACYKATDWKSGAKYCHNCKTAGGNTVKWSFKVMCDKKVAGAINTSLTCGTSIPAEGEQLRQLQASAKASLPASTQDCPK
jgi:hypothetical protein